MPGFNTIRTPAVRLISGASSAPPETSHKQAGNYARGNNFNDRQKIPEINFAGMAECCTFALAIVEATCFCGSQTRRPVRLSVRRDFHSLKRSSTLLPATIKRINTKMANHKSSLKRIRQTATRRLHNRYYAKTMRNAVRKLKATTEKSEAAEMLPKVQHLLDKLTKMNVIHKNKAANLKSAVSKHVNSLQ